MLDLDLAINDARSFAPRPSPPRTGIFGTEAIRTEELASGGAVKVDDGSSAVDDDWGFAGNDVASGFPDCSADDSTGEIGFDLSDDSVRVPFALAFDTIGVAEESSLDDDTRTIGDEDSSREGAEKESYDEGLSGSDTISNFVGWSRADSFLAESKLEGGSSFLLFDAGASIAEAM